MDPKPFNKDPFNKQWSDQALALVAAEKLSASIKINNGVKVAVADGECPYCGDHLREAVNLTAVTEGDGAALTLRRVGLAFPTRPEIPKLEYVDVTFTCGCGVTHPEAPKDTPHGCGTSFRLSLPFIA